MEWDLFICHASEDKDEFVRPLVKVLQEMKPDLKIWYDEFTLNLGDPLRQKIEYGLVHSKFGVIILSHQFFKKKWPKSELDGLFARENTEDKVILPVWYNIKQREILKYSPILADRVAAKSMDGLQDVAKKIIAALTQDSTINVIQSVKHTRGSFYLLLSIVLITVIGVFIFWRLFTRANISFKSENDTSIQDTIITNEIDSQNTNGNQGNNNKPQIQKSEQGPITNRQGNSTPKIAETHNKLLLTDVEGHSYIIRNTYISYPSSYGPSKEYKGLKIKQGAQQAMLEWTNIMTLKFNTIADTNANAKTYNYKVQAVLKDSTNITVELIKDWNMSAGFTGLLFGETDLGTVSIKFSDISSIVVDYTQTPQLPKTHFQQDDFCGEIVFNDGSTVKYTWLRTSGYGMEKIPYSKYLAYIENVDSLTRFDLTKVMKIDFTQELCGFDIGGIKVSDYAKMNNWIYKSNITFLDGEKWNDIYIYGSTWIWKNDKQEGKLINAKSISINY